VGFFYPTEVWGTVDGAVRLDMVYTTLTIGTDNVLPTIVVDWHDATTTKPFGTVVGSIFDADSGLAEIIISGAMGNQGRRFGVGVNNYEFEYNVPLQLGRNNVTVLVFDQAGNSSERTVVIQQREPSEMMLTIGSTETVGVGAHLDVAPTLINGVTFLPIRYVFQDMLKGEVDFNAATQTITANFMDEYTLVMTVGSTTAMLNGEAVELTSAPFIEVESSRALAPIRTIMQMVGITVHYNPANGVITIVGAGDVTVREYPPNVVTIPAPTPATPPPATPDEEDDDNGDINGDVNGEINGNGNGEANGNGNGNGDEDENGDQE